MAAVVIPSPVRASDRGLVAEDVGEVGDGGGDFGDRRCGHGIEGEPGDGGRRYGDRDAERRGVARIVVVADCQSGVIECGHGVAVYVFGLKSCQKLRRG